MRVPTFCSNSLAVWTASPIPWPWPLPSESEFPTCRVTARLPPACIPSSLCAASCVRGAEPAAEPLSTLGLLGQRAALPPAAAAHRPPQPAHDQPQFLAHERYMGPYIHAASRLPRDPSRFPHQISRLACARATGATARISRSTFHQNLRNGQRCAPVPATPSEPDFCSETSLRGSSSHSRRGLSAERR